MNKLTQYLTNASLAQIRTGLAIASLLLSLIAFYSDGLMNSDGILYMNMANAYLSGGLLATAKLYDWPFFSILVATLHQLSGLSIEQVAQLLNTVLYVIFTDAILLVSSRILNDNNELILATVLIICFITLNDYRAYIIRDIGYWSMMTLSLFFMMKFIERPSWALAVIWQSVTTLAFLFRVEAIAFLILIPLVTFLKFPIKTALSHCLKLFSGVTIVVNLAALFFLHRNGLPSAFGKVDDITHFLNFDHLAKQFSKKSDILADQVLSKYAKDYSQMVLGSGLIFMFFLKVLNGLSISYVGVYLYSLLKRQPASISSKPDHYLVLAFATINAGVLLTFLFSSYFVSTRYTMLLLVTIFILMLPRLCLFIKNNLVERHHFTVAIVGLILFVGLIDSMTSTVTKGYIKETAIWASQNLPHNTSALTDDIFIKYYFDSNVPKSQLKYSKKLRDLNSFDYLILVEKVKDKHVSRKFTAPTPLFRAENNRGDHASVYKIVENAR